MKFYIFEKQNKTRLAHSLNINHIEYSHTVVPEGGGQTIDKGSYLSTGLERCTSLT